MKIHEYQAKAILAKYGVPVPRGEVAFTPQEVPEITKRLGTPVVVVKAQIHAGGRGKGGGVKLAKSVDEAETIARELIGKTLITSTSSLTEAADLLNAACSSAVSLIWMICSSPREPNLQGTPTNKPLMPYSPSR